MPASLLERAFDPAAASHEDGMMSGRILDGALAVAAAAGLRNLTMDAVAGRAGVGRMTVYRHFGDRDRLIEALSVREARRCIAVLEAAVDPRLELPDRVAEGFVVAMRIAREHPLLNRLARVEPEALVSGLTAEAGAMFGMLRSAAAGWLSTAGVASASRRERMADVLVRLCVSFVLFQDPEIEDDAAARRLARELIAPMAGRLG